MLYFVDYVGLKVLEEAFSPKIIKTPLDAMQDYTNAYLALMFFAILSFMYLMIPKAISFGLKQGSASSGAMNKALMAARLALKAKTGGTV